MREIGQLRFIYLNQGFTRMKLVSPLLVILVALVWWVNAKIPNPYKVLGISKEANSRAIKQAFKRRTIKYHPDRNKGEDATTQYAKVVNAYELLKDPERRRRYDMTGDDSPQADMNMGGGFGFPGGTEGFINLEDLFGAFGGGFGGGFGGQQQRRQPGGQQFTFSFGERGPRRGGGFEF